MDPFESVKQAFFQECDELATDAEQGRLVTDADEGAIKEAFEFVEYDCTVSVTPEGGWPSDRLGRRCGARKPLTYLTKPF